MFLLKNIMVHLTVVFLANFFCFFRSELTIGGVAVSCNYAVVVTISVFILFSSPFFPIPPSSTMLIERLIESTIYWAKVNWSTQKPRGPFPDLGFFRR